MTPMDDFDLWARQQLDADAATLTDPYNRKSWHARDCESVPDVLYPDQETGACDCGVPATMLREIEGKRQTLDEHTDVNDGSCGTCVDGKWGYPTHGGSSPQQYPCRTLRILFLPYAGRPGYREEWKP